VLALERVRAAYRHAAPFVAESPIVPLSDSVFLKLECLQPTGSYKVRGFAAAALALPPEALERGLITMSAGNAAQAAAFVAQCLGTRCKTVMPDTAPQTKIDGVLRWNGEPVLLPRPDFLAWIEREGWRDEPETFIHPFANEDVIAGHGGVGLEILEQVPTVERVVVAVGGGALITGIASAIKSQRSGVEIVAAQSDGYALWPAVFAANGPVRMAPNTIADGTTAPYHPLMHEHLRPAVDRWVVVPEARLRRSIPDLIGAAHVVAEGAGALAYAALDQLPRGPVTVAVISGGNIARPLLAELLREAD
jgi:threonine dehydratase